MDTLPFMALIHFILIVQDAQWLHMYTILFFPLFQKNDPSLGI